MYTLRGQSEEFKVTPESLSNAALVYDFSSSEVKSARQALIALSMLDGTFEPRRSRLDPIEVALVEHGHAVAAQGQHRWAALQALGVSEHSANVLDIGVEYAS